MSDELLKQPDFTKTLQTIKIGFWGDLILKVILLFLVLVAMYAMNDRMSTIVQNYQARAALTERMAEVVRLRMIAIYRMGYLDDLFERDEEWMSFQVLANQFVSFREAFFKLDLSEAEIKEFQDTLKPLRESQPILEKIANLFMAEENEQAIQLVSENRQLHKQIMAHLSQYLQKQRDRSKLLAEKTHTIYIMTAIASVVIALLIISLSGLLGRFVRTRVVSQKLEIVDLIEQLQNAHQTLDQKVKQKTRQIQEDFIQLEAANRKIVDSINYAKNIQLSILPQEIDMKPVVNDYFVYWKPKDIVGGDCYWIEEFENGYILAVIDCTGHGVPGALMTMLAFSTLRRILHMTGNAYLSPALLLRDMSKLVRASLYSREKVNKSNDGMDIGICYVDKMGKQVTFAGANINLFSDIQGEINIIKGDRQSIGYANSNVFYNFKNTVIDIKQDSQFYLMTDGFLDQGGGDREFAFGKKRLMQTLQDCKERNLAAQKEHLISVLSDYQGDYPQRDDMTLLGFRVSHNVSNQMMNEAS